jgi:predicted lipoprotein with Yx(FWY)xxD motif
MHLPKGVTIMRIRSTTFLAATVAAVVAASVIVGCGGSSGSNRVAKPTTADGRSATPGVAEESLGKILVDAQGRTLYLFQRDSGTSSACTGNCAINWPPLRANANPTVGSGANTSIVGPSSRSDRKPQVTYNGHPLYRLAGDRTPGDTNGQGVNAFGGLWYAVSPSGDEITTPGRSSGGYGY